MAAQRAAFAGGGVDAFSGSPVNIQEATIRDIERESRLAELESDGILSTLKINQGQNELSGMAQNYATSQSASTARTKTMSDVADGATSLINILKD